MSQRLVMRGGGAQDDISWGQGAIERSAQADFVSL